MRLENSERINFSHTLLDTESVADSGDFASCLNARGMYESRRFVLRLNPMIHGLVDSAVKKSEQGETNFSSEELQAYSTYLHETIHWWQHKGSTSGFIRSMIPPLQTHANLNDLRSISASVGPQKSIKIIGLQGELGLLPPNSPAAPLANTVTNNFMDTEFFIALTLNPTKCDMHIYENNYFESAGHSFLITYHHVLGFLRTIFDEEGVVIPDPEPIEENLKILQDRRVTGYYRGTPIIRAPLGLLQIYEGQARFNQLHFLNFASDGLTFEQVRANGFLNDVYGEAFKAFLELTKSVEPTNISDPLVALFLLVCDLSINPTAGFPSPVNVYEYFFLDADPGIRFTILCKTIAEDLPEIRNAIVSYSPEEYWSAAKQLCESAGFDSYVDALIDIVEWKSKQPKIENLLEEHHNYEFSKDNIVPRVLFSEFLKFSEDKLKRPEFFCWPGYWLTHPKGSSELDMWIYHLSLFSDKEEDSRVFAREVRGHNKSKVLEVFNQFFAAVVLYDLTRQWVLQSGQFNLNYSWLILPSQEDEFNEKISATFENSYGSRLESFTVLKAPDIPRT
jgi:hypothetical protein